MMMMIMINDFLSNVCCQESFMPFSSERKDEWEGKSSLSSVMLILTPGRFSDFTILSVGRNLFVTYTNSKSKITDELIQEISIK